MQTIVIKNIYGQAIYLHDIAKLVDTVMEKDSYSRINSKNVRHVTNRKTFPAKT